MKNKLRFLKNIYFKKDKPVSLIIFLTERCNARCSFCFIDFDNKETQDKKKEISVEDFNLMSKSLKGSLHHLNFTGGEPFLRGDFGKIISNFIENCDLSSIVISTNGSYPRRIKE
jgi:molybdenum cofactor biosynthesis enzyme MoaA